MSRDNGWERGGPVTTWDFRANAIQRRWIHETTGSILPGDAGTVEVGGRVVILERSSGLQVGGVFFDSALAGFFEDAVVDFVTSIIHLGTRNGEERGEHKEESHRGMDGGDRNF